MHPKITGIVHKHVVTRFPTTAPTVGKTEPPTKAPTKGPTKPIVEHYADIMGYKKEGSHVHLLVKIKKKGPTISVSLSTEELDEYQEGLMPIGATISFTTRDHDAAGIPKDAQFMNIISSLPQTVAPSASPTFPPTPSPPTPSPTTLTQAKKTACSELMLQVKSQCKDLDGGGVACIKHCEKRISDDVANAKLIEQCPYKWR
jgi:hypothetical protein